MLGTVGLACNAPEPRLACASRGKRRAARWLGTHKVLRVVRLAAELHKLARQHGLAAACAHCRVLLLVAVAAPQCTCTMVATPCLPVGTCWWRAHNRVATVCKQATTRAGASQAVRVVVCAVREPHIVPNGGLVARCAHWDATRAPGGAIGRGDVPLWGGGLQWRCRRQGSTAWRL